MTSVKRVHNFNAGPSAMPVSVLEKAQADLLDKRSAWDVLQHVIAAMATRAAAAQQKPENEENTDTP